MNRDIFQKINELNIQILYYIIVDEIIFECKLIIMIYFINIVNIKICRHTRKYNQHNKF